MLGKRELREALAGLLFGYALAVAIAIAVSGDPVAVVEKAVSILTSPRSLQYVVSLWGPVALASLGLVLCYRAGFITIAVESQMLLGMLATLWLLAYVIPEAGTLEGILLAFLLSALIGGAVGVVPALLRSFFNANEILVSLMMNMATAVIVSEVVSSYLRIGAHVITKSLPEHLRLSWLATPAVVLAVFAVVWVIESRTTLGLSAKIYGSSRRTALLFGVREPTLFLKLSVLSGALAGLGGALAMLTFQHFLSADLPLGYGYSGVLAAWLSGFSPAASLASSILLSYMRVWAYAMMAEGVPEGFVLGSQTLVVVSALAAPHVARLLRSRVESVA